LLPRRLLKTLRGAHALLKFAGPKFSQDALGRTSFQRNTANPGTYHRFCSPAACFKRFELMKREESDNKEENSDSLGCL